MRKVITDGDEEENHAVKSVFLPINFERKGTIIVTGASFC